MMGTGTRVGKELRNLLHARRIKCKKSLNPALLVGLTGSDRADPAEMLKIWGKDPVHPAEPAYGRGQHGLRDQRAGAIQRARAEQAKQAIGKLDGC